MLCKHPFIRDPSGKVFKSLNKDDWVKGIPFPCGQCLPCRINKRRVWSTRLWLEQISHADNLPMLTLTYDDDNLPFSLDGKMSLCKSDLQWYIKRMRNHGFKFRYYAAGEYGEHSHRPHYHLLVFGVSPIFISDFVSNWPYGLVHSGYDTSFEASQYVAGYVTKKFVAKTDSQQREFALMSRKPALGSFALRYIVDIYRDYPDLIEKTINNFSLKVNGRFSPIGRTLVDKLRLIIGSDNSNDSYLYEMRKLALDSARNYDPLSDINYDGPLVKFLLDESANRNKQIEAHHKIWNSRYKL